jgi:hypothetical protein
MKKFIHCSVEINEYLFFLIIPIILIISGNIKAQSSPRIFINEFLSDNLSTNPDMVDFGDFSDWIELYNDETTSVNIGGFYLTDDFTQPMQWQIPANTIIPAKGFYLFWADGFNDTPGKTYTRPWWPSGIQFTTKWCHTNFKLNKGGDDIGLFNSSGVKVDSVSFPNQLTDVSFGRQPDGSSNWFYFGEPTPLKSNTGNGLNTTDISGDVNFSSEGGFYQSPIQVSLSSSSGSGTIRYTTDGSKPINTSLVYTLPISINKNTVIRARVFENSKLPGKVTTNTYFINEVRNLPVVSLVTNPAFLWDRQLGIYLNSYKDREIPVSLEYFPLSFTRAFNIDAGARIGGENIYRFAQKPFNIYTRADYGQAHLNYKIFDDLPYRDYNELYLRNSGSDWTTTMFRDGMIVTVLKNKILNSLQDYRPAVMYLNGQYWGINNIREKVNEQFLMMHYNIDQKDLDYIDENNNVLSGDSTDYVNLLNFMSSNNLSDSSNYNYVASRINIHDLMDFVIAQDYIANSSWGHNREMWRDRKTEKLWRWILVDMDRGFDAARITTNQLSDIFNNFGFFRQLCNNSNFKNDFIQRYSEHLNHTFSNDRVVYIIDSIKSLIENEMPRHIQKWGTLIDSLSIDGGFGKHGGIPSMTYWDQQVENLKTFSAQRPAYAIQYLSDRFGLTGRANLKITSNVITDTKLVINGFYETLGENNLYYKNIPVPIKAYAPPGYRFKQWTQLSGNSLNVNLIPTVGVWKYNDGDSAPIDTWKGLGYDDSGWKTGNAQFGYGEGDESTVIDYGPDSQNKYITSYYRNSFQVDNPANINSLTLKLLCDDGAVIYLNGNEVSRPNMPSGTIDFSTLAQSSISGTDETTFTEYTIDKSSLVQGQNVIAVEVHQSSGSSSDVSFDLSLDATLNQQTQTGNVIGTEPTINYTILNDAELLMEFEKLGTGEVPEVLNNALTLYKSGSPYFITKDLNIGSNGILTVEPGVVFYFSSGKSIYVKGKLLLEGTESEPITLMPYFPDEKWGAICFDKSNGISELNYVNISGSTNGNDTVNFFAAVSSLESTVNLNHVHFNNVKLPISTQFSNMIIDNCKIENVTYVGDYVNCTGGNLSILNSVFNGNDIEDMDAIDIGSMIAITEIKNNIFRDFTGNNSDGVDLGEQCINVVIENNLIMNCFDKGISIGMGSNALISHNTIVKCGMGVGIKDSLSYGNINNCTFYNNGIDVDCFEKVLNRGGGSADIKNSIFANSVQSPFLIDDDSRINISYSISNTSLLPGQVNILAEPLMVNPDGLNFHIQTGSPCIDKGDPQSPPDNDGTRDDIGAYMYAGVSAPVVVINEINYNSSSGFDPGDWIELCNATKGAIDISGWVFMDENRTPSFVMNTGTVLQPSSYIVISRDSKLFNSLFPAVSNYVGDLSNGLSGGGEALYLYNISGQLVDSLIYNNKSPWPKEADGGGSTLELRNPGLENALGVNWSASTGHGTPGAINSTYVTGVKDEKSNLIPTEFLLRQNYPNPFNPVTKIKYELPKESEVKLIIYNILGEKVAELVNEFQKAEKYEVEWNAERFASGVYIYQITAGDPAGGTGFISSKKLLLMK